MKRASLLAVLFLIVSSSLANAGITLSYCFGDGSQGINFAGNYTVSIQATDIDVVCNAVGASGNYLGHVSGAGGYQLWGPVDVTPIPAGSYNCTAYLTYFLGGLPKQEQSQTWNGVGSP